jgi:hypothetical protein
LRRPGYNAGDNGCCICIKAGVDIPTVSRWLGHQDGGALAMKVYGHLRNQHSQEMAKKVRF